MAPINPAFTSSTVTPSALADVGPMLERSFRWIVEALSACVNAVVSFVKTAVITVSNPSFRENIGTFIVQTWEALRDHIVNLTMNIDDFTKVHPYAIGVSLIAIGIPEVILLAILLGALLFQTCLSLLGFAVSGVASGSLAAAYQSESYGAFTPPNSVFSGLQAAGASRTRLSGSLITIFVQVVGCLMAAWGVVILKREWLSAG